MKTDIVKSNIDKFAVICMHEMNENFENVLNEAIAEKWENAKTEKQFVESVLNDESLMDKQFYGVLSQKSYGHYNRLMKMVNNNADDVYITCADTGSVLLKSSDESFSVKVPNGYGDGKTKVSVFESEKSFNEHMMNFTGIVIEGKFKIMKNDCDSDENYVVATISGKYFVYNSESVVALVHA